MKTNIVSESRFGRFALPAVMLREASQEELAAVFRDVVVLEASMRFVSGHMDYMGAHPDFEPVQEGQLVPQYICTGYKVCTPDGGCFVTWEKVRD